MLEVTERQAARAEGGGQLPNTFAVTPPYNSAWPVRGARLASAQGMAARPWRCPWTEPCTIWTPAACWSGAREITLFAFCWGL